jgi:hypothetical protein
MSQRISSVADSVWREFRRWPAWAQLGGWLAGFWLLVLVVLWRSSRPTWLKVGGSALFALALLLLTTIGSEPKTGSGDRPLAQARPESRPSPTGSSSASVPTGTAVATATPPPPTPRATAIRTPAPTPTPTPPPTPQPVAKPTFVVNTQPVGCHEAPSADAPIVVHRPTGTIQAMDLVVRQPDGVWHREVDRRCWTRTNPGPVRQFDDLGTAVGFAVTVQPPPAASARLIDPRELAADPTAFIGRNVILQGRALNVTQHDDYTWVQVLALVPGRSTDESIVVEMRPKQPRLLRDECYRVYGVVVGTQTVTRLLTGATNVVPLVYGYAFEPAPRDRFGISCAPP